MPPHDHSRHPPPPHHHHGHKRVHKYPQLNSQMAVSLAERAHSFTNVEQILQELERFNSRLVLEFEKSVDMHPNLGPAAIVQTMLTLEAISKLEARIDLIETASNEKLCVMAPLPPHLIDFVLGLAPNTAIYIDSSGHLPHHLEQSNVVRLTMRNLADAQAKWSECDGVLMEGTVDGEQIRVDANAAGVLTTLLQARPLQIFLHEMVHIHTGHFLAPVSPNGGTDAVRLV